MPDYFKEEVEEKKNEEKKNEEQRYAGGGC